MGWWIAAGAMAGLLAVALALMLLPVRVRIAAGTAPAVFVRVDLRPAAGLGPWIRVADSARSRHRRASRGKASKAAARRPRRRAARRMEIGRALHALPDLARGLLRVIRLDRLRLDVTFGLDDPADTGSAYGTVAPPIVAAGYALGSRASVRIVPVFDGPRLDGAAEADLTLRPARAILPALRFAWALFGPRR
jgi:hypothetical protein